MQNFYINKINNIYTTVSIIFHYEKEFHREYTIFQIALDPDTNQIPDGFFLNLLLSLGYQ